MAGMAVNFELKKKEINENLKRVLFESMLEMIEIAKKKVPVKTGKLRNSIILFPLLPGSVNYFLVATASYAEYVEYGTPFQDAQPFMRPALFQVKENKVKSKFANAFR
jgi:HK97 gp10 family phage protein